MEKKTRSFNLRERLQSVIQTTKESVENVDLTEVKGKIQETGATAKEAVKKVKLSDIDTSQIKGILNLNNLNSTDSGKTSPDEITDSIKPLKITSISSINALKIIYYLMAVDGQIFHSEEDKFDAIGQELDPNFRNNRDQIINSCQAQLDKVIDPEDYYDTLQDGVEDALISSRRESNSPITPKLLLWNLLTVAYSDESYDDTERKLLKYIVRKLDIDKAVFLEMESCVLTLIDIEKELAWIKTTSKPYLTIEAMVNELADRKGVILESVKDLITL